MKLQRAQLDETINRFYNTVLTAVQEVDNAASSYRNSIKQIVACREMVNQGKRRLNFLLTCIKHGLSFSVSKCIWMHSVRCCLYENAAWCRHRDVACCFALIQMYQALGVRVVRFL
ncbi:MAG: hypothetical protein ACLUVG_22250 [Phocaeicola vulgatus]